MACPPILRDRDVAPSHTIGVMPKIFAGYPKDRFDAVDAAAEAGLRIERIINAHRIVNWTTNSDVQNRMRNEIEDYLHELKQERAF